ncbi:hypothetical protein [Chlamydia suis]|uniref:Uncharacterized protein n=1 Tax=Chlamydia suis TaxID=83559 RepID=A0AAQ0EQ75_9CHLA|nr:hypothetical protein [Chlamydia suis]MEB2680860.1 hypothetical protein [Chlamydia suis]MEB2682268.1 hypothetical protein [Chlamydia suis]MEB2683192.1 hypothetical protein [Chlamydia suis]MEB2683568.1 hypothetical protein [Chlamydia suis]MEB2685006.1 hypothetical protein [Chlamydia suis]
MNKKIIIHKKTAAVPPTQPPAPVTKMLLECAPSQTGGTSGVDGMVTTAHVNLNAKSQQVRQVAEGTDDQDVIVLSQLEGYLQKGSRSIAGLFLPTSGGMMVGDINMGTNQGNTIKGLPSSWGEAAYLGNDYAASIGIVKDVLGDYGDHIKNLIDKITKYAGTGEGSLDQLLTDLGSPKENSQSGQTPAVTLEKPEEAKWLLLSAKNAMTGTLRLEQKQGALPTDPDPTIKNLKTGEVGVVGTATPKDKLQKIIAVSDLTTILNDLQNNTSSGSSPGSGTGAITATFPQWTGQEVPYLMYQSPDNTTTGGTQNPVKSTNADNYIKKDNGTYSLLRRGIYLVTFAYEFTSPAQNGAVTCTGTLTAKTTTTTGGTGSQTATPETVFSTIGSSDGLTVTGSSYILVPGEQAFSEYTLEMKLTSGDAGATATASKSYVAISYMGAGY